MVRKITLKPSLAVRRTRQRLSVTQGDVFDEKRFQKNDVGVEKGRRLVSVSATLKNFDKDPSLTRSQRQLNKSGCVVREMRQKIERETPSVEKNGGREEREEGG